MVLLCFPRTPAPVMGLYGPIDDEMYLDDEVTVEPEREVGVEPEPDLEAGIEPEPELEGRS